MENIKLLLVYPFISQNEKFGTDSIFYSEKQKPLGVYYLAAYIKKHGFDVDVLDANALELTTKDIISYMKEGAFNVLGISSATVVFHRALELAEASKQAFPGIPVIIGGSHVSSQPTHPLEFDAFDYAVFKEGEETLLELLENLKAGKSVKNIKGIAYKSNGNITVNPPRDYIKDLDRLPMPAYELIQDFTQYYNGIIQTKKTPSSNIITSRGCPYRCTFCEKTTFGGRLRLRSAESVVSEIEYLIKKRGVRDIYFVDDTFTIDHKRIYKIFELTREKGLKFSWSCLTRVTDVDEALIQYMKKNGCWFISLGIESGDNDILNIIKKDITPEQADETINLCRKYGIVTKGFFMIGHPGETLESIERTIQFAVKSNLDYVSITINTPMPGSKQYKDIDQYGTLDEKTLKKYNYWSPVFIPHGLTKELLVEKQQEFQQRFDTRPGQSLRYVRLLLFTNLKKLPQNMKILIQSVLDRR